MLPAFTIFDTETTGLDPKKGDRILEIAAVRIEDGIIREDRTFVSFVNPERPISRDAMRVNGITEHDVADAPTIDVVLPQFLEFAAGSVLVAQNAQFDMAFLEREKECCWGYIELPECFCTVNLSRSLYPRELQHNLDALARRFGLSIPAARHRALPDVILTAQVLLKLLDAGKISSLDELRKKGGITVIR